VSEALTIAVLDQGHALRFPQECPRCGRAADTRVRSTKIFARRTLRGVVWIHHHIDALACADCAREHQTTVRPDPELVKQATRRQATRVVPIIGAGTCVAGCGVLLTTAGVAAASRHTSALDPATVAVLGLAVAGTGLGLMAGGWLARRLVVVPADWPDAQYAVEVPSVLGAPTVLTAPASPLARAVDFSDDRSDARAPSWRTFTFARASYAQEFARLNAQHVYDRQHPQLKPAFHALPNRRTLYYVAGAALAAAVAWWVGQRPA
jgi:hypothetical protein